MHIYHSAAFTLHVYHCTIFILYIYLVLYNVRLHPRHEHSGDTTRLLCIFTTPLPLHYMFTTALSLLYVFASQLTTSDATSQTHTPPLHYIFTKQIYHSAAFTLMYTPYICMHHTFVCTIHMYAHHTYVCTYVYTIHV